MNWFSLFGLVLSLAEAAFADAAQIAADQAVASPPVFVTLDGHKYEAVLSLTPAASPAAPA